MTNCPRDMDPTSVSTWHTTNTRGFTLSTSSERSSPLPPRDNEETQPSRYVSAWYGKVKPRVCTPNPTPQVLQQQVLCKPRKQKCAKVKAPTTATQKDDKECHKILQGQDSYHTKVKALKYLEFTQDTIGHQKVMEKLSAPRIKYQTTRMMHKAQDMHINGCQSSLRDRHYDSM